MYSFYKTPKFQRKLKKIGKKNKILLDLILRTLAELRLDPKSSGLESHLVGHQPDVGNIWSSRVTGDTRIKWAYSKELHNTLILMQVGGHDDVYRNT